MKKETTIDLAKFEEAQRIVSSIQEQFCEMVLDEIEKNPVFESECLRIEHTAYSLEIYPSEIRVLGKPIYLTFAVTPVTATPDLLSDFHWMWLKFSYSTLNISDRFIEPRKDLTVTLHFKDTGRNMRLHYKKSGES